MNLARHGGAVKGAAEAGVVEEDAADEVALEVELELGEEGEEGEGGVEVDVVGVPHVVLHPSRYSTCPTFSRRRAAARAHRRRRRRRRVRPRRRRRHRAQNAVDRAAAVGDCTERVEVERLSR